MNSLGDSKQLGEAEWRKHLKKGDSEAHNQGRKLKNLDQRDIYKAFYYAVHLT